MAARYPASLDYVSNEMVSVRGVSTQMFKVQPSSGLGSHAPGQKLQFVLPANALFDCKNSRIFFRIVTSGNGARVGQGAKSLFSRLEVSVGGISLLSGANQFNIIEHIKHIAGEYVPDCSEHGHMVQLFGADGTRKGAINLLTAETYSERNGSLFSINLGDFSTMSPQIIDTSLLSSVTLSLTLAGNEVLASCKGGNPEGSSGSGVETYVTASAASSFTIDNCYLAAEVYSINDGMYSALLQSRLAQVGALEMRVKDHVVFEQNSFTGSLRAGLSASNITKLIACFRQSTFSTQSGAVSVLGYDTEIANKFKDPVANGSKQSYVTRHQNLTCPINKTSGSGNTNLYTVSNADCGAYNNVEFPHFAFSVNSSQLPMYAPDAGEWLEMSKAAYDKRKFHVTTYPEWLQNKWFMAFQTDLPNSGTKLTGIDTRAANSSLSVDLITGSVEAGFNCLFIVEKVNTLVVGNGKAAEVIN